VNELLFNIELLEGNQGVPFELLELADPSKNQIEGYLKTGKCFVAKLGTQLIGVMVLTELTPKAIEISRQSNYNQLIIGTGNSSIGQLYLYQVQGFEIDHIEKDYFLRNYHNPFFENGIQCKHKVVLVKELN